MGESKTAAGENGRAICAAMVAAMEGTPSGDRLIEAAAFALQQWHLMGTFADSRASLSQNYQRAVMTGSIDHAYSWLVDHFAPTLGGETEAVIALIEIYLREQRKAVS